MYEIFHEDINSGIDVNSGRSE